MLWTALIVSLVVVFFFAPSSKLPTRKVFLATVLDPIQAESKRHSRTISLGNLISPMLINSKLSRKIEEEKLGTTRKTQKIKGLKKIMKTHKRLEKSDQGK